MGKRKSGNEKTKKSENKHDIKQNSRKLSSIHSPDNENNTYYLGETPYHPQMDHHISLLSKIPSPVQRSEFIKQLHRTYGNRYVQRLMDTVNVQAKLNISQPGDSYEQEADRVADVVTGMINSQTQRQSAEEDEELIQGKPDVQKQSPEEDEELMQGKLDIRRQSPEEDEELMQGKLDVQRQSPEEDEELMQGKLDVQRQSPEEDEELVQGKLDIRRQSPEEDEEEIQGKLDVRRQSPEEEEELQTKPDVKAGSIVTDDIETRINSKKGGGQPLSNEVREPMEQAFGTDFGGVHVHTDTEADTLNQELSAKAFTTGKDVFFREGEYSPGSDSGKRLIAHELTHVVQQTGTMPVQNRVQNENQTEVYPAERRPVSDKVNKPRDLAFVQLNGDDRRPSFWQRTKAALKAFMLFVEACASIGSAVLEAITAFASLSSFVLVVQAVFSAIKALFDTVLGLSKFIRAVLLAWKGKVTSWFTNLLKMEGIVAAIKAITSPAELVQKMFALAVGFLTSIRGKLMEKGYKIAATCVMGIETVLGWVGTIGTLLIKGASLSNLLKLIPAGLKTIRTAVAGAEASNPKEQRQGQENL